ncbi:MAG: CoA transferase [Deltaproteobacteria bacterium]|nr:CoA transferase [Deltaproteobacteria bacterium]
MGNLPLNGIRVIDLTVVWSGPYATQMLADWGAEVIRVESCQHWQNYTRGTEARPSQATIGRKVGLPWFRGYPDWKAHPRAWNDLTRPAGMDIFKRLVPKSDLLIENNSVDTMDKMGISYDLLKELKPDIIMIRMPGWGLTGPNSGYRAFGLQMEHTCGHSYIRGYRDTPPTTLTTSFHCDAVAGGTAAFAALMALRQRDRTGKGQFIEIPQIESMIPQLGQSIMDYTMNGRVQTTVQNWHPSLATAPHNCYRCLGDDRWINITVTSEEEWEALCGVMGRPEWIRDERFADALSRVRNQEALDKRIEAWTVSQENILLMHRLQEAGVPAGAVYNAADAFADPHLKERGFFQEMTQEDCGAHLYHGLPWKASKTPNHLRLPPCRLGEHNEYVYKEVIGVSDEEYAELEKAGHIGMDFIPGIP